MSGMKLFLVQDAWNRTDEETRRKMRSTLLRDIESLEEAPFSGKVTEEEVKRLAYFRALLGIIDWMEEDT